jgi:hypothetical protein
MLNHHRASAVHVTVNNVFRTFWHRWALLIAVAWLLGPSVTLLNAQTYVQSIGSPTFSTKIPVENGYIDASNDLTGLI